LNSSRHYDTIINAHAYPGFSNELDNFPNEVCFAAVFLPAAISISERTLMIFFSYSFAVTFL